MNPLSTETLATSRKIEAVILQKLASVGQARVAEALGISESTVSRLKDGDISRFSKILAEIGLKAVPVSYRCYKPDYIEFLLQAARIGVRSLQSAEDLIDEDLE